ncbi:unnamed protein product [Mytilus edulis]|uniref:DZIP3-like HEPN domain-containing protein n=1 Tax=Mytilus edulis TaxID=6550 RepID=A0A8S3PU71_MYTED|nr:unnamed protein product [Mytilus edulis]
MCPNQVALPQNKGWDDFPKATDTSDLADLARVKWYRNFVSHDEKGELTLADFNNYRGDLEQQFVDLKCQLLGRENKYNKKFKEIDDQLVEHTDELVEHKDELVEHKDILVENEDKLVELDDQIDNMKKTHFHTDKLNDFWLLFDKTIKTASKL